MNRLLFSVENIGDISDSSDPNFCNIVIDAFSDQPNAHNLKISEDTLRKSAESIYEVPIVFKYDPWKDDLGGHEPDEVPCGFISKIDNPIQFVKTKDNNTMLRVFGKIWKRYSGKLIDILKRDGGKKAVSVEMEVLDFDEIKSEIKNFAMRAVTIIGVEPAIPDAKLTVLSFAKDKENYYKAFESSGKKIYKIDLSKDSAYMEDSAFRNEGRKLYGKMLSAENGNELVNACYLSVEDGWRDSPSTKLKYPVGKWRGDTLCLSRSALEFAKSKIQAQGILVGFAVDKLKTYCERLGLSSKSFSTNFEEKEEDKLEEKVMMEETKEEEKKFEDEKPEPEAKLEDETKDNGEAEEKEEDKKEEDFACKFAEVSKKLEEYTSKFAEQEEELNVLRKYKADKEESEKNYAIEQTMAEVNEYLPKDEVEKFRAEAAEVKFSEVEAFKNKIKARSLDFAKTSQIATNRMAIVRDTEEKKDKWGW